MMDTFANAPQRHQRRLERERRLADLEATYASAVSNNTRSFHAVAEAARTEQEEGLEGGGAYGLELERVRGKYEEDYDGGGGGSNIGAWLGIGMSSRASTLSGAHTSRLFGLRRVARRASHLVRTNKRVAVFGFALVVAVVAGCAVMISGAGAAADAGAAAGDAAAGGSTGSEGLNLGGSGGGDSDIIVDDAPKDMYYKPSSDRQRTNARRSDYFQSIIVGEGVTSAAKLQDEQSAQYRALRWLVEDDDFVVLYDDGSDQEMGDTDADADADAADAKLVEDEAKRNVLIRYSLTVLYYSTSASARPAGSSLDRGDGEGSAGHNLAQEILLEEETMVATSSEDDGGLDEPQLNLGHAGSSTWHNDTGWLSSRSVCDWHGVACSGNDELHTSGNSFTYSAGPALLTVNLTDNGLRGSLPSELITGLSSSLRVLDLSANRLTGTIPTAMGHAMSLTKLYLDGNELTGTLPKSLGALSHLSYLFLNGCMLSGTVPSELGQLIRLRGLGLHENTLTGTIPSQLGNLADLIVLYLDVNELTGTVPPTIADISTLADLRLRQNNLVGTLPNLPPRVEIAYLDNNDFGGTIPDSYGTLRHLTELHLYRNAIGGTLPPSLGNLDDLTVLYLDHNRLSGTVPTELGGLADLESLYLFQNVLTGPLPGESMSRMTDLRHLRLSDNRFNSTLPSQIGQLFKLEDLYLENNEFHGTIPETFGLLDRLENLSIQGNNLNGSVADAICHLTSDRLTNFVCDCREEVQCSCCTQCM